MRELTAVDAFCGAGGLSLGLQRAGFRIALAFDHDQVAVDTHRKNLNCPVELIDARDLDGRDLLAITGLGVGDTDVLAGGPPCQGFSLQRRGSREDERNELVLRYLEWIEHLRPRTFVIENVPAITSVRGRHLLETIGKHANDLDYNVHSAILDAALYGVPQHRRRAFFVAVRADMKFAWPEPTVTNPRTVMEAIGDLESPPEDGRPHPMISNHFRETRLSPLNIERIRHVPPGGGRKHLPEHLQLDCHKGSHRHLDTYGRLAWDAPSVTITARFDSFTRGKFGHPVEDRSITIREGARLQSFPDDFVFIGNREETARLVGNAVPPLLAQAIGESLRAAILADV